MRPNRDRALLRRVMSTLVLAMGGALVPENTPANRACALLASYPHACFLAAATAAVVARKAQGWYLALAGTMVVALLATSLLKDVIKESRPAMCPDRSMGTCDGYGMPSSHSASVASVATSFYVARVDKPLARLAHGFATAAAATLGMMCAASRVVLHYHSVEQVAAGLGLGAVVALAYWPVARVLARSAARKVGVVRACARAAAALAGVAAASAESAFVRWWTEAWSWAD